MTDEFIIPLNGLKPGKTCFSWRIGVEFFRKFENADIINADLNVDVEVEKSGSYIGIDCDIDGTLTVPCDRCMDNVEMPISTVARLSVKFGPEPVMTDEVSVSDEREIVYLSEDEADMDMSQTIYDFSYLALPMQRVHEDGECNPVAMRYLSGEASEEENVDNSSEKDTYNPFAVLKGLNLDK